MVEVAGVEPASLVLSYAASTRLASCLLSLLRRDQARYAVSRFSKVQPAIENQIAGYAC